MVVAFLVASQLSLPDMLPQLMGLLLLLNFMTATQDIAVDGLAVDLLPPEDLGIGNAAQVVGFKVGMTIAGGVLVWLTGRIDWSGAFVCMAVLVAIVALVLAMVSEPAVDHGADPRPTESVLRILQSLWHAVRVPGTTLMLAVIATYKMGESIIDIMFKPFLMEHGILASQLGLWMGTWGMGASILGSVAGGMLAMRYRLLPLLLFAGTIRLVPELGQLGLAMGLIEVGPSSVIAITLAEHLAGGVLTTVMFASMMGWVDRRIGATHFTLLASVEVWGKSVAAFVSGIIAEHLGYSGAFAIGIMVGVVFLVLVTRLPGSMEPARQQR
jgi:predicted MFS family arabinose efflux permease